MSFIISINKRQFTFNIIISVNIYGINFYFIKIYYFIEKDLFFQKYYLLISTQRNFTLKFFKQSI